MSEPFVFDPRCDLCKEPFGAVPCGTAVTFHCRPLATEGFPTAHWSSPVSFRDAAGAGTTPGGLRRRAALLFRHTDRAGAARSSLVSLPLLAGGRHRLSAGQDRLPQ